MAETATDRSQEPWLFFHDAGHWRWVSWGEVCDWTHVWAERIDSLAAGRRVGFKYLPRPECIVLDLAIQESGRVPVPLGGHLGAEDCSRLCAERHCDLWVEARRAASHGSREARSLEFHRLDRTRQKDTIPVDEAVMVVRGGLAVGVSEAELLAWVEAATVRLLPGEPREILISAAALEDPLERLLVAWAAMAGAALVLEPEPQALLPTTIWARPTIFAGTGSEVEGLRRYLQKADRSLFRSPCFPRSFRRLHTVIRRGDELLSPDQEACWRQRQVSVLGEEELLDIT